MKYITKDGIIHEIKIIGKLEDVYAEFMIDDEEYEAGVLPEHTIARIAGYRLETKSHDTFLDPDKNFKVKKQDGIWRKA